MSASKGRALTVTEAAAYLGVHRSTLYRVLAECGTGKSGLPVVHVRGRRLFRQQDLDDYLDRQTVRGGPDSRSA